MLGSGDDTLALVCGPGAMVEAALPALRALGYGDGNTMVFS